MLIDAGFVDIEVLQTDDLGEAWDGRGEER